MFRLKHVVQRRYGDCAIAAVAMIANVSYKKTLASGVTDRGLWFWQIRSLLKRLTNTRWRVEFPDPRPLSSLPLDANGSLAHELLLVGILAPGTWRGHAIVVFNGWVHDPSFPKRFRWTDYPRANSNVGAIFRPKDRHVLSRTRLWNWVDSTLSMQPPKPGQPQKTCPKKTCARQDVTTGKATAQGLQR